MSSKMILREPMFIEDGGEQIAVLLPIDTYRKLQAAAKRAANGEGKTEPVASDDALVILAREAATFERLKPELMKAYRDKYVSVVGGEVVEVGDDELDVIERVYQKLGQVVMFVGKVTDELPHVYHISSPRLVSE